MKAVKKAFALYDKIMKRYDPIISKCVHDNIFAIAGQSAFFIVLSSVPRIAFGLSILQGLHISTDFIEQALQSVFTDEFLETDRGCTSCSERSDNEFMEASLYAKAH